MLKFFISLETLSVRLEYGTALSPWALLPPAHGLGFVRPNGVKVHYAKFRPFSCPLHPMGPSLLIWTDPQGDGLVLFRVDGQRKIRTEA